MKHMIGYNLWVLKAFHNHRHDNIFSVQSFFFSFFSTLVNLGVSPFPSHFSFLLLNIFLILKDKGI